MKYKTPFFTELTPVNNNVSTIFTRWCQCARPSNTQLRANPIHHSKRQLDLFSCFCITIITLCGTIFSKKLSIWYLDPMIYYIVSSSNLRFFVVGPTRPPPQTAPQASQPFFHNARYQLNQRTCWQNDNGSQPIRIGQLLYLLKCRDLMTVRACELLSTYYKY